MKKARFFQSVYPDFMTQRDDGSYVDRKDSESLAEALLQNIYGKQRQVEDCIDSALDLEKRLAAMTQERDELAAKLAIVWQPIETAPDDKIVVVGWLDADDNETPERHAFDRKEDGSWTKHENLYQEFCAVAPPGSRGPSEQAPYTYWLDVPPLPFPASYSATRKR